MPSFAKSLRKSPHSRSSKLSNHQMFYAPCPRVHITRISWSLDVSYHPSLITYESTSYQTFESSSPSNLVAPSQPSQINLIESRTLYAICQIPINLRPVCIQHCCLTIVHLGAVGLTLTCRGLSSSNVVRCFPKPPYWWELHVQSCPLPPTLYHS